MVRASVWGRPSADRFRITLDLQLTPSWQERVKAYHWPKASQELGGRTMKVMPSRLIVLVCSVLLASTCSVLPLNAQENTSASQAANDNTVEGTVASASRDTLVVRTDDHFQLFTYERAAVRPKSIAPGDRVRVTTGPPDENGTRTASDVTVLTAASGGAGAADKGAQAAPAEGSRS